MTSGQSPDQREHWTRTFATRPDFLGGDPSEVGRAALARFEARGARDVLELGPGQGRDTLLFAAAGLAVTAIDYAETGLAQVAAKAAATGLGGSIRTLVADVRAPLPFEPSTFDAAYAHMLLCMSLTTAEIERLAADVRRVLRPAGLFVYTARNTSDAHYRTGVDHGDDRWEMGGFVVHFFDRALVDRLADGFEIVDVSEHEEGKLPRRLFAVTIRKA